MSTALPTAAAPAPSTTKTSGEADDERDARDRDPAPRATVAEPVDVDGRDRREVARDERQHARRHHGDEPGEERDRELFNHRTGRARRPRAARRPDSARAATGRRPRRVCATSTTHRRRARPRRAAIPPSGSTQAMQVEPVRLRGRENRDARTSRPSRRGSAAPSGPAAIRRAISAFICVRDGESDSSSVSWHSRQTSSVSRSDSLACVVQAAAGAASTSAATTTTSSSHELSARLMPSSSVARDATLTTCGGTTLPRRSTKKVSGVPVTPQPGYVLPDASRTFVYVTPYRFR